MKNILLLLLVFCTLVIAQENKSNERIAGRKVIAENASDYESKTGHDAILSGVTFITNKRSNANIQQIVKQNFETLRNAYNNHLRVNPDLNGEVMVRFIVNGYGKVTSAEVEKSTMNDSDFENIVVNIIKSWDFGKHDDPNDVSSITYPFVFKNPVGKKAELNNNEQIDIKTLFSLNYERPENPDGSQLSIIQYILRYTYENNIHKMRGETENKVYTKQDGSEAVFDKNGNLVTNSYNKGSFNYYSNETEPIKKFIYDIALWLKLGNAKDDPTTFNERLYYYTLDLNYGIQKYIFEGSQKTLETVSFEKLSTDEKEVYYIFLKLLFNENYKVKLNEKNLKRLKSDAKYYHKYFFQIQKLLNIEQ